MDKAVRVGVIGAGGIANGVHFPSLKELAEIGEARLVAVCDDNLDKVEAAQKDYGFEKTFTDHREFLKEDLDAVLVLVQPDKTYRVVHDVIAAGKNVLMEKPAGINAYQAHSLERQAAVAGVLCGTAMNRRAIPLVQLVLKKLHEATEITQVDGMFIKFADISQVWDYSSAFVCDIVHAVDLVRYIAGSEVKDAATVIARNNSPVDNAWSSVMRFENGITGTLRSNYQSAGRVHDFTIHGPGATAFINLGFGGAACDATIMYGNGRTQYSLSAAGVTGPSIEKIDGMAMEGSEYHQYYGYKSEDANFLRAVRGEEELVCPIGDAAKSMDMVEFLLSHAI